MDQRPLNVVSSMLAGRILRQACNGDELHITAFPEKSTPPFFVLQPGGLRALEVLGIEVPHGISIKKTTIRDRSKNVIVEYDFQRLLGGACPMIFEGQEFIGSMYSQMPTVSQLDASVGRVVQDSFPAPGIRIRVYKGTLHNVHEHILYVMGTEYVGMAQMNDQSFFYYAISSKRDNERDATSRAMDECMEMNAERGALLLDTWVPLSTIALYDTSDEFDMAWGSARLALHPFTGQHISFFACEALRYKRAMSAGMSAEKCAREFAIRSKSFYDIHKRVMRFYVDQTFSWRVARMLYPLILRHSHLIRERAIRRITLLN
ncbi:MAG: hypothetical protein AAB372_02700 [Patescibacteria group bacterium]